MPMTDKTWKECIRTAWNVYPQSAVHIALRYFYFFLFFVFFSSPKFFIILKRMCEFSKLEKEKIKSFFHHPLYVRGLKLLTCLFWMEENILYQKLHHKKVAKPALQFQRIEIPWRGGGYNLRRRPMYPVASKIVSRNYLNNFIISNVWSILNELKFSTICGNRFFIGHILYLKLENFFLFVYLFK